MGESIIASLLLAAIMTANMYVEYGNDIRKAAAPLITQFSYEELGLRIHPSLLTFDVDKYNNETWRLLAVVAEKDAHLTQLGINASVAKILKTYANTGMFSTLNSCSELLIVNDGAIVVRVVNKDLACGLRAVVFIELFQNKVAEAHERRVSMFILGGILVLMVLLCVGVVEL